MDCNHEAEEPISEHIRFINSYDINLKIINMYIIEHKTPEFININIL